MNLEYTGAYILKDFFNDSSNVFQNVEWNSFHINKKVLSRTGCFQGIPNEYNDYPWLRCPSISEVLPVTEGIDCMAKEIETKLNYTTNIFKIQKYDNGNIVIGPHADKIIDLDTETPIFIARFGATRTCILGHKISKDIIKISMDDNSLLVIPYKTNLAWKHHIQNDPEITEPSYSIVFRNSVTYRSKCKYDSLDILYGKNTPFKTKNEINNEINNYWSQDKQNQEMIKLYNIENNTLCDISLYNDIINNCIYP